MASASAQWLEQLRLDLPAQRANQRSPWLRKTLTALPVEGRDRASLLGLCGELQISGCRKRVRLSKAELVEKVLNEVLEQLPAASSSGASMISTYLRTVRAELRQQHPEGREAWLKAEIDSMRLKQGIHDKPSLVDFCKYLNLTVGNAGGQLKKPELLTKAVEKLMSEARHVVASAASSSSSGVDAAVVKRFVQVLRVALTQQNPEERRSNLERDLDALSQRTSKDGKPSLVDILPVLDTTSSGRKRRTASKGSYDLQHSWQVDWTTAGHQCSVINSGYGFYGRIHGFFCLTFAVWIGMEWHICLIGMEWHICLSSCFVWVCVLCMMRRNIV